jgi:hypothetical protein
MLSIVRKSGRAVLSKCLKTGSSASRVSSGGLLGVSSATRQSISLLPPGALSEQLGL